MTVNELTKVNVGGTTHAPLSCNPRVARGRIVCRACIYLFFKLLIYIVVVSVSLLFQT